MPFSVLNNIAGMAAQKELSLNSVELNKTLYRISSGKRINSGADDAAGLAIADGLRGQMMALDQAVRNANDGIGFLQTADGALSQVTKLLHRAVTLATEASTSTNAAYRNALDSEYQQIRSEINRIANNTYFNGTDVFGTMLTVFVGDTRSSSTINLAMTSIRFSDTTVALASISGDTAMAELSKLQSAITTVALSRGSVGAQINRLQSAIGVIMTQSQNIAASESEVRDANMAAEVANLTRAQILAQSGISALSQANSQQQNVLSLFR